MGLQSHGPGCGGKCPLVSDLPIRIPKYGERIFVPKVHELIGLPVKDENPAVPMTPRLVGDAHAKFLANGREQMFAFQPRTAAVHCKTAKISKLAVIGGEGNGRPCTIKNCVHVPIYRDHIVVEVTIPAVAPR